MNEAILREDINRIMGFYSNTYLDDSGYDKNGIRALLRELFDLADIISFQYLSFSCSEISQTLVECQQSTEVTIRSKETGEVATFTTDDESTTWQKEGSVWRIISADSSTPGGIDQTRYENEIRDRYRILQSVLERESISDLETLISADYLQDGVDADGFLATFEDFFDLYDNIRMEVTIRRIEFDDFIDPKLARVEFNQFIEAYNVDDRDREVVDDSVREMFWVWEGTQWRMFGNQEGSTVTSQSIGKRSAESLLGGSNLSRNNSMWKKKTGKAPQAKTRGGLPGKWDRLAF